MLNPDPVQTIEIHGADDFIGMRNAGKLAAEVLDLYNALCRAGRCDRRARSLVR